MILVIGGAASGKRSYARSLGYGDEQMADALLDDRPVVFNVQDMVTASLEDAPSLLEPLLTKELVLCNEVGSGVIPANRTEREGREATGRLCNQLAQQAEKVVRLVAGIPSVIKG
jgi:adenosyl cobinamide kinase/adenosyl cobinamide phosphate guanylyltransferase